MTENNLPLSIFLVFITLIAYQAFVWLQKRLNVPLLNPMLLSIAALIPFMLHYNITFSEYSDATFAIHMLLEPAVVALGFPLYQHLRTIRQQASIITSLLALGVILVIVVSFTITAIMVSIPAIAVSLSLKSVTTPIAIALTEDLNGDSSITAFAIILAGQFGALLGPKWLNFINVKSAKAQGLAIGAASHALGTATVSKISYEHGAYSSLSLILSAVLTAIISPSLITLLTNLFY